MANCASFAPIADSRASRLLLGSMPGKASLRAGQYYAHPRNSFWLIMGDLIGADAGLSYASRIETLKSAGIALWDVLASCTREGSLDSGIDAASAVPNDLASFLLAHPGITQIFFNGKKAEECFFKYAQPTLGRRPLLYRRLPSTSPAHAAMPYEQKLKAWETIMLPPGKN